MTSLRWSSSPEDRDQYLTPKDYDYTQAVQGTAPLPIGNAGDLEGFVGPQKNVARGKGAPEKKTRGRPARAGKNNSTRKDGAKTREKKVTRGSKDPDPILDPNLDPDLQYSLDPIYQRNPNVDLNQGAAPNRNDTGASQGYGSVGPQDIEGGNRWLNSE